jgi:hypothetical protein
MRDSDLFFDWPLSIIAVLVVAFGSFAVILDSRISLHTESLSMSQESFDLQSDDTPDPAEIEQFVKQQLGQAGSAPPGAAAASAPPGAAALSPDQIMLVVNLITQAFQWFRNRPRPGQP